MRSQLMQSAEARATGVQRQSGPPLGPPKQADPRENPRLVSGSGFVCQTSSEAKRTQAARAHHPWLASVAQIARDHGAYLCVV